jgi:hypothetical protein
MWRWLPTPYARKLPLASAKSRCSLPLPVTRPAQLAPDFGVNHDVPALRGRGLGELVTRIKPNLV